METSRNQYYDHTNHISTYYPLYISLEKWLAEVLFKQDTSRIFLSSNEYVYRRRFELTDPSQAYESVSASSLQFPFGNYWPLNSGWRPDPRIAALTATMVEEGIYTPKGKIRAMAVYMPITFVAHFDREDDARIAYERLLWVSYRERYFETVASWQGERLGIPMNIRIEDLSFNPRYTERDWLESNRIFVVEALINLRSYIVTGIDEGDGFNAVNTENPLYFLTEEAVLEFSSNKGKSPDVVVGSLLDYNPSIKVNQLGVTKTTQTTATIQWDVTADQLSDTIITISTGTEYRVPKGENSFRIKELIKGSEYSATITFTTSTGLSKKLEVQFTTKGKSEKQSREGLVGTNW